MDTITQLKNAIEFAKQNPDAPQSIQLRRRIESGMYSNELAQIKKGSFASQPTNKSKAVKTVEKIADITGGKEIAQGLGQSLAGNTKRVEETQNQQIALQGQLLQRIKEKKARGEDTSRLEGALQDLGGDIQSFGNNAGEILNPNQLTSKQVIGDALQLGSTVVGAGTLPGQAGKVATAKTIGQGIAQGAKTGAITGGAFGAIGGVAQGLQQDKTVRESLGQGLKTGAIGAAGGAVIGSVLGGISGGLTGRRLRKEILSGQIKSGQKTLDDITAKQAKTIELAKTQGIDESDISFISTMKSQDKVKAQKMVELAKKAMVDKRSLERPIDVVGDSLTDRIKYVQKTNSSAGKAVDTTAKALKGQMVDATPVRERALTMLEDIGVTANKNGTPNWSKSIFNKNPELQKKIIKTLSDLPAGEIDAYDLHNFKKSIDEVVNYGVGGEGLKGKSASILKAVRNSADEILDSTFDSYNKANTDYKTTRDVLELTQDLFGKKAGISKERGGQLLRSVFSNNTQRPRVMKLIEQLDLTAKQYGGKFDDNLIDQALFSEILEDIFGTQATTSLQGQVGRAVKGTQKVIAGLRDPIKGAGDLLATGAEKLAGISNENKRKILEALLR